MRQKVDWLIGKSYFYTISLFLVGAISSWVCTTPSSKQKLFISVYTSILQPILLKKKSCSELQGVNEKKPISSKFQDAGGIGKNDFFSKWKNPCKMVWNFLKYALQFIPIAKVDQFLNTANGYYDLEMALLLHKRPC